MKVLPLLVYFSLEQKVYQRYSIELSPNDRNFLTVFISLDTIIHNDFLLSGSKMKEIYPRNMRYHNVFWNFDNSNSMQL